MAFSSSSPSSQSLLPPPTSIVWAPLPLLSWILPLVGHVGITDSSGHIWDFAGPYQINVSFSPSTYLSILILNRHEFIF